MGNMMFSDEEIQEFKIEAQELIDSAEVELLAVENKGAFPQHYDAIFRVFHSLKGGAAMLGMEKLQAHMHSLENIFTNLKGQKEIEKNLTTFFLQGLDAARQILSGRDVQFDFTLPNGAAKKETPPLPKEKVLTVEAKPKEISSGALDTQKVLVYVLDDETELLSILETIVREADMECVSFSQPAQMISVFEERRPDVLLTDMAMPGMTGMDVLRVVKGMDPDVPVVFLSGYLSKEVLIEAIQFGLFAAIEKPCQSHQVVSTCLSAARQHHLSKMFNRAVNLLLYQFSDLESYLRKEGKEDIANAVKKEVDTVLSHRRKFRQFTKEQVSEPALKGVN